MILHQNPHSNKGKSTPIYAGGRVVGKVQNGIFYKSVSSKSHFLRQPPAIANDLEALDSAESAGASCVDILDKDTGKHYAATIEIIRSKGFALNRGFGAQIALTLAYWSINGKTPIAAPTPKPPKEPTPEQFRLW